MKDLEMTSGGCGCGCGGHGATATADATVEKTCGCGSDCGCGCNDGQPCTCGDKAGTTATYTVTGMTCGHCVKAVTDEVSAIHGVTSVDVDLASGRLVVNSAAPVDFDRIVEAVGEAGDYTVE